MHGLSTMSDMVHGPCGIHACGPCGDAHPLGEPKSCAHALHVFTLTPAHASILPFVPHVCAAACTAGRYTYMDERLDAMERQMLEMTRELRTGACIQQL